jgi:hypothetical protein
VVDLGPVTLSDIAALAGVLLAIGGITATVTIYLLQRKRKRLIYEVVSDNPLVVSIGGIDGRLEVNFDGKRVEHARLMTFRLANSGNVPI